MFGFYLDPYNWTGTNAVLRGKKMWKVQMLAFCLMIGYEFFLDTVVTLTFFQCFIFLAAFSSWPRSFIICQKKSEMWVSTGLFEIQQVNLQKMK